MSEEKSYGGVVEDMRCKAKADRNRLANQRIAEPECQVFIKISKSTYGFRNEERLNKFLNKAKPCETGTT